MSDPQLRISPQPGLPEPLLTIAGSGFISVVAYHATAALVPLLKDDFIAVGLKGIDLLKGNGRDAKTGKLSGPALYVMGITDNNVVKESSFVEFSENCSMESTGLIGAAVYLLLLTFFAPLPYYSHFLSATVSEHIKNIPTADAGVAFPHHSLSTYLASLLSLLIATFLGFLDDLFDIRWRYKLPIPSECLILRPPSRAC